MSTIISTSPVPTKTLFENKAILWSGRVISTLPALFLLSSGINALTKSPMVVQGTMHLGYSVNTLPIIGMLAMLAPYCTPFREPRFSVPFC